MSAWKVLFILLLACVCLGLALATLVVPLAMEEYRWLWFTGFLLGTITVGTLFALYLKHQDRTFRVGR